MMLTLQLKGSWRGEPHPLFDEDHCDRHRSTAP